MKYQIINDDCIKAMKEMDENSVDSIVTDPPYELGFMGKKWDSTGIAFNVEVWSEALRVLKPGGHLIAFSGSRTYHRMAVAIEDAGFEIRDQIMWVYGSGFPKSLDISKAIDKRGGNMADFSSFRDAVREAMKRNKVSRSQLEAALGNYMLSHYLTLGSQPAVPNYRDFKIIRDTVGLGDGFDHLFAEEAEREITGMHNQPAAAQTWMQNYGLADKAEAKERRDIPATDAAKQWQGWGTALKPAHEPMVLARKPVIGTVASNVLTYGTGGLNIDGTRVGFQSEADKASATPQGKVTSNKMAGAAPDIDNDGRVEIERPDNSQGRFPANFIHDGLDTEWARFFYCAKASKRDRNEGLDGFEAKRDHDGRKDGGTGGNNPRNRTNIAKVNHHPTVKPTDLMQYLCRLITPPNGIVLDPFMGSGSTGKGAIYEGFNFIGIEQSAEYCEIAKARIEFAIKE